MLDYGLPVFCACLTWWLATGVVLYVDGLPRRTFSTSIAAASLLALAAAASLIGLRDEDGVAAAYAGFFAGLAIWGWHELMFLTGYLTGPRRGPAPEGAVGWRRFRFATEALLWHELAILATAGLMALLSLDAANQMALWTFLLLWGMRLSAKMNVFFGVPNLAKEFLPNHLRYLESYFRHAPMNLFFPVSVTAGSALVGVLAFAAAAPEAGPFETAAFSLLAALAALAVLEHWFMVLPIQDAALWRWALEARARRADRDDGPEPARDAPHPLGTRSRDPFAPKIRPAVGSLD